MSAENKPADDQNFDLLQWPPANFRDDFTPPKAYVAKLTNHMLGGICTLNNALPSADAPSAPPKPVAYHSEKDLAVFFCSKRNAAMPTKANVQMGDWFLHKIEENPGVATRMLIHSSTGAIISQIRKDYGNVTMKMHPVPHPQQHGVFSISEIYILHPNYENTLFDEAMKNTCLHCQKKTTCGACRCEKVFFCSQLCRERAMQSQLHTEEECLAGMTNNLIGSMADARRIMNEHADMIEAEKEATGLSLKMALEEKAKADVVAIVEPPKKSE